MPARVFNAIKAAPWLSLAVAALIISIWMGRYSIAGGERAVHRLDRWTGSVTICTGDACR